MLLTQQLSTLATQGGTRAAIRYLGKDMSYADFKTKVARLSYLYQHELGHGHRVAFLASNCLAYAASFFALTNIRSTVIPLDPDRSLDELVEWIKGSKATHLAVTSDLLAKARDVLHAGHLNLPLVEIERKQGGEYDTSYTPQPEHTPTDKDPILLLRSGASVSKGRYVVLNHQQLQHACLALRSVYHAGANDAYLTPLRWAHPYAFIHGLLLPLMTGGTCVVDHGMEDSELLKFIADSKVTRLVATPPWCLKILRLVKEQKRMLPGVKSVTVGLGSISNELAHVFEMMKIKVAHCYGQAEAGWTLAMEDTAPPKGAETGEPRPWGHVGRGLVGMKYKVLDPQGDAIEGGDTREGLLAVTTPSVMSGYYGPTTEAATKETKNALRGTWLYTGDYARLEGEGDDLRVTFLGRREEVLAPAPGQQGEILNPRPIDLALRSLAGVIDGAGFLLKDSMGRVVLACAVVKPEKHPLNEKAVLDHVLTRVQGPLAPKVAVFTDFIPRDAGGNVNRMKLQLLFSGSAG